MKIFHLFFLLIICTASNGQSVTFKVAEPSKAINADTVSKLHVQFAGKSGKATITPKELLQDSVLTLINPTPLNIRIVSFDVTVLVDGTLKTHRSISERLSENQKELLRRAAKYGKDVFIEQIYLQVPDGSVRQVHPIHLRIIR